MEAVCQLTRGVIDRRGALVQQNYIDLLLCTTLRHFLVFLARFSATSLASMRFICQLCRVFSLGFFISFFAHSRLRVRLVLYPHRIPRQHTIFPIQYATQTCEGPIFANFGHTSSHSCLISPRHIRLRAQENRIP